MDLVNLGMLMLNGTLCWIKPNDNLYPVYFYLEFLENFLFGSDSAWPTSLEIVRQRNGKTGFANQRDSGREGRGETGAERVFPSRSLGLFHDVFHREIMQDGS